MSIPNNISVHANRMQCANSISFPNIESETEGRQASAGCAGAGLRSKSSGG